MTIDGGKRFLLRVVKHGSSDQCSYLKPLTRLVAASTHWFDIEPVPLAAPDLMRMSLRNAPHAPAPSRVLVRVSGYLATGTDDLY
jgi:hypothetical protein